MVGSVFRGRYPLGILRDLQHVSEVGLVVDQGDEPPGHRDGWGIVSFRNNTPWYLGRSERPMHLDPSFDAAFANIRSLEGPNVLIAHARRGSEGSRALENTHPFVEDGLVFAHNGTVKKFAPQTMHRPKGQTDSERLFAALLDRLDGEASLRSAVKSLIREDVAGHEYSAVILLISDGRTLLGYRGYGDERNAWYYDLRVSVCPEIITVFQETRAGYSGEVIQLQNGEMVSVNLEMEVEREMVL